MKKKKHKEAINYIGKQSKELIVQIFNYKKLYLYKSHISK